MFGSAFETKTPDEIAAGLMAVPKVIPNLARSYIDAAALDNVDPEFRCDPRFLNGCFARALARELLYDAVAAVPKRKRRAVLRALRGPAFDNSPADRHDCVDALQEWIDANKT